MSNGKCLKHMNDLTECDCNEITPIMITVPLTALQAIRVSCAEYQHPRIVYTGDFEDLEALRLQVKEYRDCRVLEILQQVNHIIGEK